MEPHFGLSECLLAIVKVFKYLPTMDILLFIRWNKVEICLTFDRCNKL